MNTGKYGEEAEQVLLDRADKYLRQLRNAQAALLGTVEALKLVLALNTKRLSDEEVKNGWIIRLDPKAEQQIKNAITNAEIITQ